MQVAGSTVYRFKGGSRFKVDAQIVGNACEELEKQGNLTAKALVDVARDEENPLHEAFEWDDTIAAEEYRKVQAGQLIRSIEVVYTKEQKEPVRAFLSISSPRNAQPYQSARTLLSDENTRAIVLKNAVSELKAFKHKYQTLQELADIFNDIDRLQIA